MRLYHEGLDQDLIVNEACHQPGTLYSEQWIHRVKTNVERGSGHISNYIIPFLWTIILRREKEVMKLQ